MILKLLLLSTTTTTLPLVALTKDIYTNDVEPLIQLPTNNPHFIYVSCHFQRLNPSPFWNTIQNMNGNVLIHGGDNMYSDQFPDQLPTTPETIAAAYDELDEVMKPYQARLPSIRLAVWDDHDFGINDGDHTWKYRKESQTLFLTRMLKLRPNEFNRHRFESRQGVYSAQIFQTPNKKRIKVILLDVRFNKDPWPSGKATISNYWPPYHTMAALQGTILGKEQWLWLERVLCHHQHITDTTLIISGIQMLAEGRGAGESWSLFPLERIKLLNLLGKCRVPGVLLISGDVHFAEVEEAECGSGVTKDQIVEITSSGMTHSWETQPAPHAPYWSFVNLFLRFLMKFARLVSPWRYVSQYYLGENFLSLKLNMNHDDDTIVTDIYGLQSNTTPVISRTWKFKELTRTGISQCVGKNHGILDSWIGVRVQLFIARFIIVLVCFIIPFIVIPIGLLIKGYRLIMVKVVVGNSSSSQMVKNGSSIKNKNSGKMKKGQQLTNNKHNGNSKSKSPSIIHRTTSTGINHSNNNNNKNNNNNGKGGKKKR
jgi:alkaline phosphatase D